MLLRVFRGSNYKLDTPAVMPSAAQATHRADAVTHRHTATRKDQQQNQRDASSRRFPGRGDLLGIDGARGVRTVERQAQSARRSTRRIRPRTCDSRAAPVRLLQVPS